MYLIFTDDIINIWDFLTLGDVLTLSTASKFTAGLMISDSVMNNLINGKELTIGRFEYSFPRDLTIGMFRRVLNRLYSPANSDATVYVSSSGRVVLDIGSALNDKDAFLAAAQCIGDEDDEDEGEMDEAHMIHRHIEVTSCDEYDDFVPRHPIAKGAHRRGDSYFNSDIDVCANELIQQKHVSNAFNMSAFADSMALENDYPSPHKPVSAKERREALLKNKTMNKATNKYPGITRSFHTRTDAAVTSVDSDEER
jgi:hypothetical protein